MDSPPVRAEALRAVVRIADPLDQPLFERLLGQASDLDAMLSARETPPLESSLREQLATAHALATEAQARVVIWANRQPETLEIVVADLLLERVLRRALEGAQGREARSAQDEAAALVVRSALKASLAGEALGSPPRELLASEEPALPVKLPPLTVQPPPPTQVEPAPAPAEKGRQWLLALGALGGGDGVSAGVQYGISARAAWFGRWLELGLRGSVGLRAEVPERLARLELAQHRLSAYVGVAPLATETLRLTLSASAGLHVFVTKAESTSDSFEARSGRETLSALGAMGSLSYTPAWTRWGRARAGIAISGGCSVFPRSLELGYGTDEREEFVRAQQLWTVQPVGGLELVLTL